MATTVTESVGVRRGVHEITKRATDPAVVLPLMGGLGRFQHIDTQADGTQHWDVFLDVGSLHVGGRVEVRSGEHSLTWRSTRGTRHSARLDVRPAGEHSVLRMELTVEFAGAVTGRVTELLARGIVRRHLQAGLQQLRHHLEFEV